MDCKYSGKIRRSRRPVNSDPMTLACFKTFCCSLVTFSNRQITRKLKGLFASSCSGSAGEYVYYLDYRAGRDSCGYGEISSQPWRCCCCCFDGSGQTNHAPKILRTVSVFAIMQTNGLCVCGCVWGAVSCESLCPSVCMRVSVGVYEYVYICLIAVCTPL